MVLDITTYVMQDEGSCDKQISYGAIQYLCAYISRSRSLHERMFGHFVDVFLELLSRDWAKQAFDLLNALLNTSHDSLINSGEKILIALHYAAGKRELLPVEVGRGVVYLLCAFVRKYGLECTRSLVERFKKGGMLSLLGRCVGYCRYLAAEERREMVVYGLCRVIAEVKEIDEDLLKCIVHTLCEFIKAGATVDIEMEQKMEKLNDFRILHVRGLDKKYWKSNSTLDEKRHFMKSLEEYMSKRRMTLFMLKGLLDSSTMEAILDFDKHHKLQSS